MVDFEYSDIQFNPEALREAIADASYTQATVNRKLGYKQPNTVNKILKSKRTATATDLMKFAALLGKRPEDFFTVK